MHRGVNGWEAIVGAALAVAVLGTGCPRGPEVASDLGLRRIVLYRNGVGYFERSGVTDEELIRFQVKREQVGDFLSSLTVVTRESGAVRGVSFPSFRPPDPPEPPPPCRRPAGDCPPPPPPPRPSNMMDVEVEMEGEGHDVTVAYVVEAPVWRPTYRIVVGEDRESSLLQGWAVVQNLSGEDWDDVELTVTEGAPLTFRADLATPFIPTRPVVTDYGEVVQAPVSALVSIGQREAERRMAAPTGGAPAGEWGGEGEDYYGDRDADSIADIYDACPDAPETWNAIADDDGCPDDGALALATRSGGVGRMAMMDEAPGYGGMPMAPETAAAPRPPPPPSVGAGGAGRSLALLAARAQEGGITRYESSGPVTVPDGSSTLIAILNDPVRAEDTLLFQPDPGVPDSRENPFRVVRFTNDVGATLERGPVAILGHDQFLGQGILEPLPPGANTAIPYALERGVVVTVETDEAPAEARLVKIVRGRVTVQRFSMIKTVYEVRNLRDEDGKLWIRHARRSGYDLAEEPEGMEETGEGAALFPVMIPSRETTELEIREKSPVTVEVELLTPLAHDAILAYLEGPAVDEVAGPVLRRALEAGDRLAEMEERRGLLEERRREIQRVMQEIRADLAVLGTNPRAEELKNRLTRDLDEKTREYQDLTAQIVDINSRMGELRVELSEAIRAIDLTVPGVEEEEEE